LLGGALPNIADMLFSHLLQNLHQDEGGRTKKEEEED
jgi:hypothetical protein